MKKILLGASAFIACAFGMASAADAQTSRIYLAGYLGLSTFNDVPFNDGATATSGDIELDNATSFAGALGIRLNRNIRFEGELSYRNAELTTIDISNVGSFGAGGELKSKFAFLNLYYDFDVPWKIQPFVGGGIGYGWHDGEIVDGSGTSSNVSGSSSALAWNVGGGIKYRPRTDMAFTGSYRYVDSADIQFGSTDLEYESHEFRIGMEWDLPYR